MAAEKHRVVVMFQPTGTFDNEVREKVYEWMTPDQAESFSDKEAERIAEDPKRYVIIESNKKERGDTCPI